MAFAAFTDFGPIMALAIAVHNIPEARARSGLACAGAWGAQGPGVRGAAPGPARPPARSTARCPAHSTSPAPRACPSIRSLLRRTHSPSLCPALRLLLPRRAWLWRPPRTPPPAASLDALARHTLLAHPLNLQGVTVAAPMHSVTRCTQPPAHCTHSLHPRRA